MKKVYVVSKYAGDVGANVSNAIRYCRDVIEAGHMPIASHLLYPQMLDDSIEAERKKGLGFGLELLAMCDEVWVFGDTLSAGMKQEIAEAEKRHIPIKIKGELLPFKQSERLRQHHRQRHCGVDTCRRPCSIADICRNRRRKRNR